MTPLPGGVLIALAVIPLLTMLVAPALARWASKRLSPSAATVLLTVLAVTAALVTGLLLCLAAVVALAGLPGLSGLGHWSAALVRDTVPIPTPVGLVAGVIAAGSVCSAGRHLVHLIVLARRTSATAARISAAGELVVVSDSAAFAYAIPGRHRRIVASTGMLSTLSAPQRRFLLAHEEAHLRHHHHRYVQVSRLAAAANPLLRPIADAVALTVERWADESAARMTGSDRTLAARTIAAAALATTSTASSDVGLAAARTNARDRVIGLLEPEPRHHVSATAVAAIVLTCWAAGWVLIGYIHRLMELAEPIGLG